MKTRHWAVFILGRSELAQAALGNLKEQYPFTAHAPNFDFWTGCREIKRCEENKRTLNNPFATRLAEFDTALKLLRITDQWYIARVEFWFGRDRDFLALLLLPLTEGPKAVKRIDTAGLKVYFFCQLPYKLRNCERNTQIWDNNNRDCKKETTETWMWLRRSCGNKLRETECFTTTRL